jgi:hypothetical protein
VTVPIVDLLEAIQIKENQTGLDFVTTHHRHHSRGLTQKGSAIVD